MKILALDDEPLALESLLDAIHKAAPDADCRGFEYAEDVLEAAQKNGCDVAFLDVEMSGMNGVGLAEQLKAANPAVNIIFCTGFTRYQGEAFAMHASGYLLKPITPEKVRRELAELRRPVPSRHRLRVQCFGNFEVYLDDLPLMFHYSRTKELMAYLIDRCGALCTNGELAAVLFEDAEHESYFRRLRQDLRTTLEEAGCAQVLVQQRGSLGVVPDELDCDYYAWRENTLPRSAYQGEYMTQYSWAETTNSLLRRMTNQRI